EKAIFLARTADDFLCILQYAIAIVISTGILFLSVDIGAYGFDGLDFVFTDTPVDDLLYPQHGVKCKLSILHFGNGKRERPQDFTNFDDVIITLRLKSDSTRYSDFDQSERVCNAV